VEHVAFLEGRRTEYRTLVGRPYERNHLEELGADRRELFKRIFKKWDGEARITLLRLRIGSSAGRLGMR
jgi:hypothetical protein